MSDPIPAPERMTLTRAKLRERLEQQISVAEFGRTALMESDIEVVLNAAVTCCAESLGAEFSKILEYVAETDSFFLRAGHGWGQEYIGMRFADADMDSAAGFALHTGEPVMTPDLQAEERFGTPALLRKFNIRSAINVLIRVEGENYGILEVDSPEVDAFEEDDKHFLASFANHLAAAIERHRLHDRLTAEMRQSEMLLRELQHRVKNNLQVANSLISMQRRTATTDDGRRQLDMVGSRIGAMQVLFDQLYKRNEAAGTTDLSAYLRSLCANLTDFHGFDTRGIRLDIDIEPLSIEIDRAVPLGLIVNEFIVNSFKHAFTDGHGCVTVTLKRLDEGRARIRLADDGIGFEPPAGSIRGTASGLGLTLINALMQRIEGEPTWSRQGGTALAIDFVTEGIAAPTPGA